mmetsp:Transcript_15578/g.29122  ORF Transcript_15578/g.29122 Transcript_15578/m.29122 type:complete len:124 (+) Transcript_15578:62-433(+)
MMNQISALCLFLLCFQTLSSHLKFCLEGECAADLTRQLASTDQPDSGHSHELSLIQMKSMEKRAREAASHTASSFDARLDATFQRKGDKIEGKGGTTTTTTKKACDDLCQRALEVRGRMAPPR